MGKELEKEKEEEGVLNILEREEWERKQHRKNKIK